MPWLFENALKKSFWPTLGYVETQENGQEITVKMPASVLDGVPVKGLICRTSCCDFFSYSSMQGLCLLRDRYEELLEFALDIPSPQAASGSSGLQRKLADIQHRLNVIMSTNMVPDNSVRSDMVETIETLYLDMDQALQQFKKQEKTRATRTHVQRLHHQPATAGAQTTYAPTESPPTMQHTASEHPGSPTPETEILRRRPRRDRIPSVSMPPSSAKTHPLPPLALSPEQREQLDKALQRAAKNANTGDLGGKLHGLELALFRDTLARLFGGRDATHLPHGKGWIRDEQSIAYVVNNVLERMTDRQVDALRAYLAETQPELGAAITARGRRT